MTSEYVTFDDFLDSEPDSKTVIKKEKKPIIAPPTYKGEDHRDTKANWNSPVPEEVVMFWSITTCSNCGAKFEHPTYEENSMVIRYRVSKFRAILKPYSPALALMIKTLTRVKCITQSSIHSCVNCFENEILYTDNQWSSFLENNSPPKPDGFEEVHLSRSTPELNTETISEQQNGE